MFYKILQKPLIGEELLPMTEINDHLRVYDPHEEALLEVYRDAAIDFAEQYMNRALGLQTVIATFETYKPRVYLPLGNINDILTITAINSSGEEIVIEENDYKFNAVSNTLVIDRCLNDCTEFMITYEVGDDVANVPKAIKLGIMKLIATWFENREDISNGVSATEIPFNHKACFNLYRVPPMGA